MYQAYKVTEDDQVLNATPAELVRLLYAGAIGAVEAAREAMRHGDVVTRGGRISKAGGIVMELTASLNHAVGGEISKSLAELYLYLLTTLNEAHREQSDEKLALVENILRTLESAWQEAPAAPEPPTLYGYGVRIPGVYV